MKDPVTFAIVLPREAVEALDAIAGNEDGTAGPHFPSDDEDRKRTRGNVVRESVWEYLQERGVLIRKEDFDDARGGNTRKGN